MEQTTHWDVWPVRSQTKTAPNSSEPPECREGGGPNNQFFLMDCFHGGSGGLQSPGARHYGPPGSGNRIWNHLSKKNQRRHNNLQAEKDAGVLGSLIFLFITSTSCSRCAQTPGASWTGWATGTGRRSPPLPASGPSAPRARCRRRAAPSPTRTGTPDKSRRRVTPETKRRGTLFSVRKI